MLHNQSIYRLAIRFGFISAVLIVHTSIALAESTGPLGWGEATLNQEMETDRPDFTEGAQTVQPGHIQFELGYTFTTDDEDGVESDEHVAPELLARIGLIEDLELRIAWGGYISTDVDGTSDDGVTDGSIGFKHRMYRQDGLLPDLSLIGELSVPVGSSAFTSDEVEPAAKFLWAYGLDDYSVAGNLNFAGPIGTDGRYFEVSNSLALGTDLSEEVGVYIEYFGFYPAESVVETSEHFANGGFTWGVSDDLQLDVRAGFGMNDAAADFFTGIGVSVRH